MHVIFNLERAGAQEVVRILARHLHSRGCVITVCTLSDGPLRSEIEKLGVNVITLPTPKYARFPLPEFVARWLHYRQALFRLVKKHKPDIIQTHLMELFDFLMPTLRRNTQLYGILWTIHNVDFLPATRKHWLFNFKKILYRILYRLTIRQADGFIAVSDQVRQAIIEQIGPVDDKIFTICNGIDVERFETCADKAWLCDQLGISTSSYLLATVGRLTEQKGHRYLIEAAQTIIPSYLDAHFLFIGEGALDNMLMSQVRLAGLEKNIHFLGSRNDIPKLLAAIDIFVLPSLWEGLSIALLEAMAAAKPVVATNVSGTVQVLENKKNGLMVQPGDNQALAEAILFLLSNPNQAKVMGQSAKEYVQLKFSAQKQAEEHLAVYQKILLKY